MTVTKFIFLIRRNISLKEEFVLFLLANNYPLEGHITMRETYYNYKDKDDNFLYICVATEIFQGGNKFK